MHLLHPKTFKRHSNVAMQVTSCKLGVGSCLFSLFFPCLRWEKLRKKALSPVKTLTVVRGQAGGLDTHSPALPSLFLPHWQEPRCIKINRCTRPHPERSLDITLYIASGRLFCCPPACEQIFSRPRCPFGLNPTHLVQPPPPRSPLCVAADMISHDSTKLLAWSGARPLPREKGRRLTLWERKPGACQI